MKTITHIFIIIFFFSYTGKILAKSTNLEWIEPTTLMEFIWVEGGCYLMGDVDGHGDSDENFIHKICLDGFWVGKYEVSQKQWLKIMDTNPAQFKGDNNPVEMVSWNETKNFLKRLNKLNPKKLFRLPTEAQWEFAAREGGKKIKYSGSNNVDEVAWFKTNSQAKTHPVGTKKPNSLGIFDMSGNVWEWIEDWYERDYYYRIIKKNQPGPPPPSHGFSRVDRGGSWKMSARKCRTSYRGRVRPIDKRNDIGFRLVFDDIKN